jgi:hypothetical protein
MDDGLELGIHGGIVGISDRSESMAETSTEERISTCDGINRWRGGGMKTAAHREEEMPLSVRVNIEAEAASSGRAVGG